ncbi:MAG: Crp/Fnr family transcriptional regulator [Candidatus Dormibacter sp.]
MTRNLMLGVLPAVDRERLLPRLSPMFLEIKRVLFEPGKPIDSVYFPLNGVISLVTPLEDGAIVEVATVGNEGVVGVPLVLGGSLAVRAISQVAGWVLRMDASSFLTEMGRPGPMRDITDDYLQALFGQISQAAACNRLHTNEERLSRWLLMSHDRVGTEEFAITHEFLGQMLGSRRATVTLSAGILQAAGLIKYHRGQVTIVDRHGLEQVACECYGVIRNELENVLTKAAHRNGNGNGNGRGNGSR